MFLRNEGGWRSFRRHARDDFARGCLVAALSLVLLTIGDARAQDIARGQQLFKLCAACHGDDAHGNRERNAPGIAGLPPWYLKTQLHNFKAGVRAYSADDLVGLQMRPMASSLITDDDVAEVIAYISTLPTVRPAPTLAGNAERGKTFYNTCLACHGPDAKGNEALKAPSLHHQGDWYLVAQLQKFRAGQRGTHKADVTGTQMRAMSMTLPDDQALSDVVAHIQTLGK